MMERDIAKSDMELIDKLSQGLINKNQFIEQSDYKANYKELRELFLSERDKVNEENHNRRFTNLFYGLPHVLSKKEEALLNGELLLQSWHDEHDEIITAFQVLYNGLVESVVILLEAFKNVPPYIAKIPVSKSSYQRKIIYALNAQQSPSKVEALNNILKMEVDDDLKGLIRSKLAGLS